MTSVVFVCQTVLAGMTIARCVHNGTLRAIFLRISPALHHISPRARFLPKRSQTTFSISRKFVGRTDGSGQGLAMPGLNQSLLTLILDSHKVSLKIILPLLLYRSPTPLNLFHCYLLDTLLPH